MTTRKPSRRPRAFLAIGALILCGVLGWAGRSGLPVRAQAEAASPSVLEGKAVVINPGHGRIDRTDSQGIATLFLSAGSYRFRTLADGTNYWSGAANHCTVPGCSSAGITTGP